MLSAYYTQILTLVGINIILVASLNIVIGYTGLLSLGHAAFMAIGAYISAILTVVYDWPFFAALLMGALIASVFGIIIGLPTLKLRGDYLAIATLGFGEIVRIMIMNMDITGGTNGLRGIPRHTDLWLVYLFVILSLLVFYRLKRSRVGRAMIAIREDETAAEAMGINTTYYKVTAFAVAAFFAGTAGGLFAHYFRYISPNNFGFMRSIEILVMVVLGGMGNMVGSVVGATVLTAAPEMLRAVSDYRMLIYGGVLVAMMLIRPQGLLGEGKLKMPKKLPGFKVKSQIQEREKAKS
ncbi:branched-chain amino acid ABC transporter permease [Dethiobacter alkaliphilus]|uniref:branched-chain amino acid ABC transporter permease n=1 Tax=Dethiobacter alkaliphilus TaxID=427926 RepID=UPI00222794E6|nr:branched-chain amino acid ABC transporter permease [Dethiobacter alkaliphilus]MCW3490116.1 branched-chain amino acid ABC transporter permease [Dethiobacter alkaliphilus]